MPSLEEISTPPSKRRRIAPNHGSQAVFSRALQVAKDAVPTSLISLPNPVLDAPIIPTAISDPHGDAPLPPASIDSCESSVSTEDQSHSVNGFGSNGAEDANIHARPMPDQSTERRTSKRSRAPVEPLDATPLTRKRRKYKAEVDTEGANELQTAEEKLNTAAPSASGNETPRRRLRHQKTGDAHESYNEGSNLHTYGRLSDQRPRRGTATSPLEMADRSPVQLAPRKPKTPSKPKTPKFLSSTPGDKRGRPPKRANATPPLHKGEESELGFREIPTEARKSVNGKAKALRSSRDLSQKQHDSRQRSLSLPGQDIRESPEDVEDASNSKIRAEQQRQYRKTIPARLKKQIEQQHAQNEDYDEALDRQIDLDLPEQLRESSNKLRQVLQRSPVESVDSLKSNLLRGLAGRRPLVNMNEEYRKVQQLVTQTVLAGEGNSMLVIGPRGCGKTALVEAVLADITREHREAFIAVRLNGFIHTDDKLALREIWRQLGREIAADEDTDSMRTNYADTLTSLLALLAYSPEEEGKVDEITRSVVFIIDEFDLFATHSRQTLLYNLFDVAQSRNAPIAVLGLTTRTDIVESLEKRVKSRFGQRYVYLTHPRTFGSFRDMCKSAMISLESADAKLLDRLASEKKETIQCRGAWNEYVEALFTSDSHLESSLRHLFARSKCVPTFLAACYLPISQLSPSCVPTGASFIEQLLLPPDSKLQHLPSLSDLELSLLIAGARLDVILDTDVCNFSMVYDEYAQLASRVKAQGSAAGQTAVGGGARVWGKEAALGAWEKLVELELLLPVNTGVSGDGSKGMCRVDVALEEIGPTCPRMGAALSKWCREI
ncbi:MAG: hypothetical protein Q9185_001998 [Variospora sp. 1 TL-2023]